MNRPLIEKSRLKPLGSGGLAAISAAALQLAILPVAQAETAPERTEISFKYLDYLDSQPGDDRIQIRAPSVMITTPITGEWSLSASAVSDAVSGASPRYHTKALTAMEDTRDAYTASVTRYFSHSSFTLGTAYSSEQDYRSRSLSLSGNLSSEDKNTTWSLGIGNTLDEILPNSVNLQSLRKKHTQELSLGVTQIFSNTDIGQFTLRHTQGNGYYSDQYKLYDARPESRDSTAFITRWNHHFESLDSTLRSSYRYYRDSFGIRSHTLGLEYLMNLSDGWQLMPLLRYYSQNRADFYFAPVANDPWADADTVGAPISQVYPLYSSGGYASMDQRLSTFGAITYGLKVTKQLTPDWIADLKIEQYQQRSQWSLSESDDQLPRMNARSIQVGLRYFF